MRLNTASSFRLLVALLTAILLAVPGIDRASADNGITYTYDSLGRVTSITDADGQTTTYAYDGNGNLLIQTIEITPSSGAPSSGTGVSITEQPGQTIQTTFSGVVGQQVRLATQWDSNIDASPSESITITAPDGTTKIYSNTDDKFAGSNAFDLSGILTLQSTGVYTIQFVSSNTVAGTVTFTLSDLLSVAALTDAAPTIFPTLAAGQAVSLIFSGLSGQQVRLTSQWDAVIDQAPVQQIFLVEPDGHTQVYSNMDAKFTGSHAFDLSGILTLPATGSYRAYFLPGAPVTGNITLNVMTPLTTPTEIGAIPTTTMTTLPGEVASLTFTGAAGQQVRLASQWDDALNQAPAQQVLLIAPDGHTAVYSETYDKFAGSVEYNVSGILTLPTSGTYQMLFLPQGPYFGNITLNVSNDLNDPTASSGQAGVVKTTEPGQVAAMTFTAGPGSLYRAATMWDSSLDQAPVETIVILGPDGQTQFYNSLHAKFAGSPTSDLSPELSLSQAGTYTIEFIPNSPVVGSVTFDVSHAMQTSGAIVPDGGTVAATTAHQGQAVVSVLQASAGETLNIVTQWDTSIGTASSRAITIIEPDGQTQLYSSNGTQGGFSDISGMLTVPTTGAYAVRFVPNGPVFGNVSFSAFTSGQAPSSSAPAELGALAIANPSFEAIQLGSGQADNSLIPGWNAGNCNCGTYRPTSVQFPTGTTDGTNVAFIQSGSISQQLAATVQPNTTYTLQVDIGARADFQFYGYAVALQAGASPLAADDNLLAPSPGAFVTSTVSYYASPTDPNIGQPLTIALNLGQTMLTSGQSAQAIFDNVRLTATAGNTLPPPAPTAEIGALVISNPSFEAVSLPPFQSVVGDVPGWATSANCSCGSYHPTALQYPNGPTDGVNVAFINNGSISQQLAATVQPNTTYTLQVDVGARRDSQFSGYGVVLNAGGTVLAMDSNTLSPVSGGFITSVVQYYASATDPNIGQPLAVVLNAGPSSGQAEYDNVRLTATSGNTLPPPTAELGPLAITNPSFEAVSLSPGQYIVNDIPGWNTGSCTCGTYRPGSTQFPDGPTDGVNIAFIDSGSISQQLAATIQANTTYTLQVDVGARADFVYGGYVVALQAGTASLATDNNTLTPSPGSFVTSMVSYYASATDPNIGQPLAIVLSVGPNGHQPDYDNVRLTATTGNSGG